MLLLAQCPTRIREHELDAVLLVVRWWQESNHSRAVFLREKGCTWSTICRVSNFEDYLEFAQQWDDNGGDLVRATEVPDPFGWIPEQTESVIDAEYTLIEEVPRG